MRGLVKRKWLDKATIGARERLKHGDGPVNKAGVYCSKLWEKLRDHLQRGDMTQRDPKLLWHG
jgi:hypothetical protein